MIKARRQLLSLVLMIVMIVSAIPVFAEDITQNAEQTWEPMDDKYDIINQLGIVSDEQWALNPDEQVTRAEFAVYMQKLSGLNEAEYDNTLRDVMSGTVEEKAIYAVYNAKIMEPVSKGYFYPSYAITQKDAIKSVVKVLGYPDTELKGLSPYDYANKVGLTEGVSAASERLTRRDVYKIIYNALFAELLDMSYTGNGVDNVTISENTYFALRYDANYVKGVVTAVGKVVLGNTDSAVKDNAIVVDDKTFMMAETPIVADLIGRNVVCYYDGDDNVLAIYEKDNEVTVLDIEDDYEYKDGMYVVYDGNKEKKFRLDSAYVLLNDEEYLGDYIDAVMSPEYGNVTLVDNDKDGNVEIVLLYNYENYIVSSVNGETRKFKDPVNGLVDLSGYEEVIVYNAKGKLISLSDIPMDSVIKVIANHSTLIIDVCGVKSKRGSVKAQTTGSDGKRYYRIDGQDYGLAPYALEALENGKLSLAEKGKTYQFYFNDENEIVYFVETVVGSQRHYGVMTALKKPGIFGGHDEDNDAVMFSNVDDTFTQYPLAEKVTVNGQKGLKYAEVYKQMSRLGKMGTQEDLFIPQVVVWGTNSKGEINYIEQASVRGDGTDGFFEFFAIPSSVKMNELYGGLHSSSLYGWQETFVAYDPAGTLPTGYTASVAPAFVCGYDRQQTDVLGVPYRYDEETKTFRVAADRQDMFTKPNFKSGGENVDLIIYKDDASDVMASLAIKCVDASAVTNCGTTIDVHMVKSITKELKNDEVYTKLVLANEFEAYAKESDFDFENLDIFDASTGSAVGKYSLKVGDLVRYRTDATGLLTAIEPVYDHVNKVFLGGNYGERYSRYFGTRSAWAIQKYILYDTNNSGFGRFIRAQDNFETVVNNLEMAYVYLIKNAYVYREAEGKMDEVVENAVDADFVGYADSKTEYVDIITLNANMNTGDVYFIYKHN